jgi:hypothetical protein
MTGDRPQGPREPREPQRRSGTERWYRAMLLGYPRTYRERHGDELLGTLLEAGPQRRLPSLRESASLLDTGVLTRLRTRLGTVPAWADGLRLGLLLLVLVKAGSLLGGLARAHQPQPQAAVLLPSLLVVVAVLLGRMGTAAVLASIPAAVTTYQAQLAPAHGTGYLVGVFSSRAVDVPASVNYFGPGSGAAQFWVIAVGSALLALNRRTRGPLPRRSWWWLTVPAAQAAVIGCTASRLPAVGPPPLQLPAASGSLTVLAVLPLIAAIGFLLVGFRATVATGDPRWAIAAGVYLLPVVVFAASLALARPSAVVALDDQLPAVLLAAACAVVLLRRRTPRRSGD